ncbi:MAG: RelA/SpoT family protein [Anaerolineales bacterium]
MEIEGLLDTLPENYSDIDWALITRAYRVAAEAHAHQKRASGESYITHCVAVAAILAELRVPPAVIAAGLLHDTVEDTDITLDDLRRDFGEEIAKLVDGVTKLTELPRVSRGGEHADEDKKEREQRELAARRGLPDPNEEARQLAKSRNFKLINETLRKTFLAMGEDPRVPLIKLADRLHNVRTLGNLPEAKRRRIARETLDIFAPLANRLGIWQLKWPLEDLAFRHVNSEMYREIANKLDERRSQRERQMRKIIIRLQTALSEAKIEADVTGRPKHIYSIYRKMIRKGATFWQIHDVRGVRIIVPDKTACYTALGIVHSSWRPIPGEFDDYIAAPKDNFYRSLHTAVIYEDGKQLEVQIRTPEMHQNAEYGIAAHWRYKEGKPHDEEFNRRVLWLRQLMDWRQDVGDAKEFVEVMKSDVLQDRVYAFTPRGDVIDLPVGSTPIDFAYYIHTEVGHRCRGAKVNGKLVSLDYQLKTGDQVEILTARRGGPSRDWLNRSLELVQTHRARSKIRRWFKIQNREKNVLLGKNLIEKELRRLGMPSTNMERLAREFDSRSVDDFCFAIGAGDLPINRIINHLTLDDDEEATQELPFPTRPGSDSDAKSSEVMVLGLKGLYSNMGKCCKPAPGDDIVGYITRGRGATIHRRDCPNVLNVRDPERLVRVSWGKPKTTYPVSIQVNAFDREGLTRDISTVIADEKISITEGTVKTKQNQAVFDLVLEVRDISQLSRVLNRIENLPNVSDARRVYPG